MTKVITDYEKDSDYVFYHVVEEPLVTTIIYDANIGLEGRGHAKCDETDTFDEAFGILLSHSRAQERLEKKYQRQLIRSL